MRMLLALLLVLPLVGSEAGIVRVKLSERDGGKIVDIPLEEYVAAVVAGESGALKSDEALKAMAVAVRTFAVRLKGRHAAQGFDMCSTTHCQLADRRTVNARCEQATQATAGELLWFEGKPALACYSRDCGGRTEDANVVWPGSGAQYLKGRTDPYCLRYSDSKWQWSGSGLQLANAVRESGLRAPAVLDRIAVLNRTASGRAGVIQLIGGGEAIAINASALRFALGRGLGWNTLRSERWDVRGDGGQFLFQGSGAGHGAGMCQLGADQMGLEGHSYRDILNYYYSGVTLGINASGLAWSRLGGERVAVMTTRPGRDAGVVAVADRIIRSLGLWPTIEVRVYPDVESFRNTTSEPGWVAAHTSGRRIHIQPLNGQALERTLRHELLHVMIEDRTTTPLPLWFREGLVAFLETRDSRGGTVVPKDADLRQTADAGRARLAYEDARKRVAALVQRYGEGTVLEWLKRGLPPEVAQANASSPPTKRT